MPVRFTFSSYKTYIEVGCYIVLMFFVLLIKIDNDYEMREQFMQYMKDFNKSYLDKDIFDVRFNAFKKSLETINQLNSNRTNTSAHYGLTKFSDLSREEFLKIQKTRRKTDSPIGNDFGELQSHVSKRSTYWKDVPQKVDWRKKGVVSGVKYQSNCGACWAFAVTETIESMQAIKSKNLTELSIQQMIDCSIYNNGCQGGDTCTLLSWLIGSNVTVATQTNYPLVLRDQKCKKTTNSNGGVRINDYVCDTFIGREDIILKLLAANGPVVVSVSGETWQNYVGGVIQFHCDGEISHAVQIVGYDLTAEVPYYIVRNSWGQDFGDNGYLYMAIGSNICHLAYEVAAVTVE